MSLLIKALDKAEKDQAKNSKTAKTEASESADWSLEAVDSELADNNSKNIGSNDVKSFIASSDAANFNTTSQHSGRDEEIDEINIAEFGSPSISQGYLANSSPLSNQNRINKTQAQQMQAKQEQAKVEQGQAANVFTAKKLESTDYKTLTVIGIACVLTLFLIGAGIYSYVSTPINPVLAQSAPPPASIVPPPVSSAAPVQSEINTSANDAPTIANLESKAPSVSHAIRPHSDVETNQLMADEDGKFVSSVDSPEAITNKSVKASKTIISSVSTTVTITKNKPEAGVNPILLNAYQAYTAGDDTKAQQLYKQVLQNEIRNIDAMLGLAAIAQRQNRMSDAENWYRKVLELDPRNPIALSNSINSSLDTGNQSDNTAAESRLKDLLAQQPDNANLQAALGGLYADQNQWSSAQQAYFEAHRLAPANADYTFNLAASLDQMGKPKLALPYYKRTLELLSPNSGNINEAMIRARIKAIE